MATSRAYFSKSIKNLGISTAPERRGREVGHSGPQGGTVRPEQGARGHTTRRRLYQVNPNNFRKESTIIFASSRRGATRRRATTAAKIHPSLDPSLPPSTIVIDSLYLIDLITVGSVVRQDCFLIESFNTMFMIVDLIMSE